MFTLLLIIFPICFMLVATIADKYLAVGMQNLSNKFGLSPTLAAVTLIAVANGAPDILGSLSVASKSSAAFITMG